MSSNQTVVVVGGGFAGVYCAQQLQRRLPKGWRIVLFSSENHLVFTPLLGDVVGSAINPVHVVWPVRQMVPRVTCQTAQVNSIDLKNREVSFQTAAGQSAAQAYDHLVLACGATVNLDIVPGMAAHAWPLKTMGDALFLRNHLITQLERAQVERDPEVRKWLLSVVVVGGGFSGVEVAGEIADLLLESVRFYDRLRREDVRVTVLQRGERILPELPPQLAEFATVRMRRRGIDIRTKAAAQAVTERAVLLKGGDKIDAGTVVCTIGTTVHPLIKSLGLPLDGNRVKTNGDFRVEGHDNLWAVGDCAAVPNAHDNQLSPPTAQFAVRQAKSLAYNLTSVVKGKPTEPFRFKPLGAFASIGNRKAVGQVLGLRFSGFPAWFMWRGIYLGKMPTLARKVQIAFDWFWQLFFPRDIVQLDMRRTERLAQAHYEPGQFVFHKGETGDRFYVIEKGRVGVYLEENGPPLKYLGPGEYFGEAALMSKAPRSASIKAEAPLDVTVLGQDTFHQLVKNLDVLKRVLESSTERVAAVNYLLQGAKDHPRLATATVRDVTNREFISLGQELSLCQTMQSLREASKEIALVVDANGNVVGLCTRNELSRTLQMRQLKDCPLIEMLPKTVKTVPESQLLREALLTLLRDAVENAVVVSDNEPTKGIGILTIFDVLHFLTV